MILVKRKIRGSILTFVKLSEKNFIHLFDLIRFYNDVEDRTFEYENYEKDFLEKIFYDFREHHQGLLERRNSFETGQLTHEYYINPDKKNKYMGKLNRYLTDLKVFNVMQKKFRKIRNA